MPSGAFREDLFFRLNVVALELPPLRQRTEDIFPLSMRALLHYGKEFGKEVTEIDAEARGLLERYHYPGNIRELQNIIERATIFCSGTDTHRQLVCRVNCAIRSNRRPCPSHMETVK